MKILTVDDDECLLELLKEMLEVRGHSDHVANSGEHALSLCEQQHFDVALVDMVMPKMDGKELIAAIKTRYKATKFIAMSGMMRHNERLPDQLKHNGADFLLFKPFSFEELFLKIKQLNGVGSPVPVDHSPPKCHDFG